MMKRIQCDRIRTSFAALRLILIVSVLTICGPSFTQDVTVKLGSSEIVGGQKVQIPLSITPHNKEAAVACLISSSTELLKIGSVRLSDGYDKYNLIKRYLKDGSLHLIVYADPTVSFITGEVIVLLDVVAEWNLPEGTHQIFFKSCSVSDPNGVSSSPLTLQSGNITLSYTPTPIPTNTPTITPTPTLSPTITVTGTNTATPTETPFPIPEFSLSLSILGGQGGVLTRTLGVKEGATDGYGGATEDIESPPVVEGLPEIGFVVNNMLLLQDMRSVKNQTWKLRFRNTNPRDIVWGEIPYGWRLNIYINSLTSDGSQWMQNNGTIHIPATDQNGIEVVIEGQPGYIHHQSLFPEWNVVGFPGVPNDPERVTFGDIVSPDCLRNAFTFDDGWQTSDTPMEKRGFFVRVKCEKDVDLLSSLPTTGVLTLYPGWNLISVPTERRRSSAPPEVDTAITFLDGWEVLTNSSLLQLWTAIFVKVSGSQAVAWKPETFIVKDADNLQSGEETVYREKTTGFLTTLSIVGRSKLTRSFGVALDGLTGIDPNEEDFELPPSLPGLPVTEFQIEGRSFAREVRPVSSNTWEMVCKNTIPKIISWTNLPNPEEWKLTIQIPQQNPVEMVAENSITAPTADAVGFSIIIRAEEMRPTGTFTPTSLLTDTPTITDTPIITATLTHTDTRTPTDTKTPPPKYTLTATPSVTDTPIITAMLTHTDTHTPTDTKTPSPTETNSPTITLTATPTETNRPIITETPTRTVTHTPTDTNTPSPTETSSPTITLTSTHTETYTHSLTRTPTVSVTSTPTNTNLPPTPTSTLKDSDINGDGKVDANDLILLMKEWNRPTPIPTMKRLSPDQ